MDLLKDTHFPGNTQTKPTPLPPLAERVDTTSKEAAFITPERLKTCIRSFKPKRGAGPDGLKPAVYQALGPNALRRLANLYKASYLLGKQPDHFKLVRVIFIPKAGRPVAGLCSQGTQADFANEFHNENYGKVPAMAP